MASQKVYNITDGEEFSSVKDYLEENPGRVVILTRDSSGEIDFHEEALGQIRQSIFMGKRPVVVKGQTYYPIQNQNFMTVLISESDFDSFRNEKFKIFLTTHQQTIKSKKNEDDEIHKVTPLTYEQYKQLQKGSNTTTITATTTTTKRNSSSSSSSSSSQITPTRTNGENQNIAEAIRRSLENSSSQTTAATAKPRTTTTTTTTNIARQKNRNSSSSSSANQITVVVKILTGRTIEYKLSPDMTFGEFRQRIINETGIPIDHLRIPLRVGGFMRNPTKTLREYGIVKDTTITVNIRLSGRYGLEIDLPTRIIDALFYSGYPEEKVFGFEESYNRAMKDSKINKDFAEKVLKGEFPVMDESEKTKTMYRVIADTYSAFFDRIPPPLLIEGQSYQVLNPNGEVSTEIVQHVSLTAGNKYIQTNKQTIQPQINSRGEEYWPAVFYPVESNSSSSSSSSRKGGVRKTRRHRKSKTRKH